MRPLSYYVALRDKVRAQGDESLARSITADLERHGYVDEVPAVVPTTPRRTPKRTTAHTAPERAIED